MDRLWLFPRAGAWLASEGASAAGDDLMRSPRAALRLDRVVERRLTSPRDRLGTLPDA